jgi:hypothetical protein
LEIITQFLLKMETKLIGHATPEDTGKALMTIARGVVAFLILVGGGIAVLASCFGISLFS